MSILIVEDNPVNARLLALMLSAQGYQTVMARNGLDALAAVPETPDLQLISTDYMMPEMDGFEFIVKVRALPTFHHVPISDPLTQHFFLRPTRAEYIKLSDHGTDKEPGCCSRNRYC